MTDGRFNVLASLAAGVSSKTDLGGNAGDLFDFDVPIVLRARYARMRGGSVAVVEEATEECWGRRATCVFLTDAPSLGWSFRSCADERRDRAGASRHDRRVVGQAAGFSS